MPCFIHNKKEDSVSPVIAVIMILMITIVMVAIAAAIFIPNANSITGGKVVGVNAIPYTNGADRGIVMAYWGGRDADKLLSIQAVVGDYKLLLNGDGGDTVYNPTIGGRYDFSVKVAENSIKPDGYNVAVTEVLDNYVLQNEEVNFVGKFTDGTEQILYTSKLTIPGTDSPGGVFYDDGDIKVVGYSNQDGWLGHGLIIITSGNVKISTGATGNTVKSYRLSNNKNTYTNNLFSSTIQQYSSKGYENYYIVSTVAGEDVLPYSSGNGFSDELSGWVNISAELNNKPKSYNFSVVIPARVNVKETENSINGEITGVSLSGNNIIVKYDFNKNYMDSNGKYIFSGNGNSNDIKCVLCVCMKKNGNVVSQEKITPGGNTVTLKNYNYYDEVELYALGGQSNLKKKYIGSTVWYLIDSKTIAELKNEAQSV